MLGIIAKLCDNSSVISIELISKVYFFNICSKASLVKQKIPLIKQINTIVLCLIPRQIFLDHFNRLPQQVFLYVNTSFSAPTGLQTLNSKLRTYLVSIISEFREAIAFRKLCAYFFYSEKLLKFNCFLSNVGFFFTSVQLDKVLRVSIILYWVF